MIERRYVFVGTVAREAVPTLGSLTQAARDSLLQVAINQLGLIGATGRLGAKFFTLVGDEHFNKSMQRVGKEEIEGQLRAQVFEAIKNDPSSC